MQESVAETEILNLITRLAACVWNEWAVQNTRTRRFQKGWEKDRNIYSRRTWVDLGLLGPTVNISELRYHFRLSNTESFRMEQGLRIWMHNDATHHLETWLTRSICYCRTWPWDNCYQHKRALWWSQKTLSSSCLADFRYLVEASLLVG